MDKRFWLSMLILAMVFAFFLGGYIGQEVYEPKVIVEEKIEYVEKPIKELIVQVEERIVEVPVEVPVEVSQKLRDFESTEELEAWLEENYIDQAVMLYASGKKFDCDDYALRLIKDADKDGYRMFLQVIYHPYRKPLTGEVASRKGANHAVCSVIIGNNVYFIEPQTDEYWLAAEVD